MKNIMNTLIFSGFVVGLVAFVVPLIIAMFYSIKKRWTKQGIIIVSVFVLVAIFINPFVQAAFLEPLDTKLNYQWRDRAEQLDIIGKTPEEVRDLLGSPHYEWTETPHIIDRDGNITWQGETYTGWEWQPIPLYWMGSRFQVFFVDGKVRNFEANDD
jgi:energy-coupling factor transporter transmembrane protein EcfT